MEDDLRVQRPTTATRNMQTEKGQKLCKSVGLGRLGSASRKRVLVWIERQRWQDMKFKYYQLNPSRLSLGPHHIITDFRPVKRKLKMCVKLIVVLFCRVRPQNAMTTTCVSCRDRDAASSFSTDRPRTKLSFFLSFIFFIRRPPRYLFDRASSEKATDTIHLKLELIWLLARLSVCLSVCNHTRTRPLKMSFCFSIIAAADSS